MSKLTVVYANLDGIKYSKEFDGDFVAQETPQGTLIVVETKPDITGEAPSGLTQSIIAMYSSDAWHTVLVE